MMKFSDSEEKNSALISGILKPDKNFDIINKKFLTGNRTAEFFLLDGFAKDDILERILESFYIIADDQMPDNATAFASNYVPYISTKIIDDVDEAMKFFLMGMVVLIVEGYNEVIIMDCRSYPSRSIDEPWKDKVLRGSRDGFVEAMLKNVTLIRRRIRDPKLCAEKIQAGTVSKTDICLIYIDGKEDKQLKRNIKKRIEEINVEALNMSIESLAESLLEARYINPFPKFKYTERPDTAASAILDGNIVIIVDNCPAVIVIPTSIFDVMEEADDFYFPPVTGTYIRFSRFILTVVTIILTPLWVLFLQNPDWVPGWLEFVIIDSKSGVPIVLQLFILEFAVDGLRLAAVNTPSLLSTPLSIVAGICVGEYAVSSGWFDSETMLYMSLVAVGTYTQTSFELGYALKFMRLQLLLLTWLFNIFGFIVGILVILYTIASNKTLSNKSYIYPIYPFNGNMLRRKLFRVRLGHEHKNQNN